MKCFIGAGKEKGVCVGGIERQRCRQKSELQMQQSFLGGREGGALLWVGGAAKGSVDMMW